MQFCCKGNNGDHYFATGGFRGKVPPFVIINLKINCKTTENQLLLIIDTSSRIAQKRVLNNHPKTWELSGVLPLWVSTMQGFALDSLGNLPDEKYTPPPPSKDAQKKLFYFLVDFLGNSIS